MYEGEIRDLISMQDFCDRYGIAVEKGFVLCPFHNDGRPSCKIYPGRRGFHCFSCGASGDVLDFCQGYFNLDKNQALRKLNADFALNLPLDGYDREQAERQLQQRRREQQRQKEKEAATRKAYWDLFDTLGGIEMVLTAFRPVCAEQPPSPLFLRALQERDHIEAELAFAENDMRHIYEK